MQAQFTQQSEALAELNQRITDNRKETADISTRVAELEKALHVAENTVGIKPNDFERDRAPGPALLRVSPASSLPKDTIVGISDGIALEAGIEKAKLLY